MNIYVETNFVLELVYRQEQHTSCEAILALVESGKANLVIPAISLFEVLATLEKRHKDRVHLYKNPNAVLQPLMQELTQLDRSATYAGIVKAFKDLLKAFVQSIEDEKASLEKHLPRLQQIANIVPLTSQILANTLHYKVEYGLEPADAAVYATILSHLASQADVESCYLSRDRHFDYPDIVFTLKQYNCERIPSFKDGYQYVLSRQSAG